MFKKLAVLLTSAVFMVSAMACGSENAQVQSDGSGSTDYSTAKSSEVEQTEDNLESSNDNSGTALMGLVDNTLAEDEEALVDTYAELFDQLTYTDEETGLSITYNLYLPEGYDESDEYPMVVFIADSSCAGTEAEYSLTQGRGALVWASSEWQSVNPTIVAVPTYPETILDDHNDYSTTEYVELTKRFIEYMSDEYAVDTDRIYGTGQSMGCMTTLILASEYPDLYAACMFVDGQWDTSLLANLEGQTFVYFAAEDDTNAWNGIQELMSRFDEDSANYTYAQWDGTWSADELSEAAEELLSGNGAYFISWKTGTIDASTGNSAMGGGINGNHGGMGNGQTMSAPEGFSGEKPEGMTGEKAEGMNGEESGNMAAGLGSVSYHMASFDYAYNCVAVMEWLFGQTK